MDSGQLTVNGQVVALTGAAELTAKAPELDIEGSGTTTVGSGGPLELKGEGAFVQSPTVQLGDSCTPVALLGSQVLTPFNPAGMVSTGSSSVCASP